MLFLWIWRLYARAAKQIIDADAVEISQRDERVHGIIQRTDLVLRVGILADVQQLRDLLLCVIMVDPQIADILVFRISFLMKSPVMSLSYLEIRYCILSDNQIKYV